MSIVHPCASISVYLAQVHPAAHRQMVWETETRKWQNRWKTKFRRKGEIILVDYRYIGLENNFDLGWWEDYNSACAVIRIYIDFLLSFTKCLQIVHGCTTRRDKYNKFHHTWLILAMMRKALFILPFWIILNALESIDFKSQHVNVVFKRSFSLYMYIAHKSYETGGLHCIIVLANLYHYVITYTKLHTLNICWHHWLNAYSFQKKPNIT